MFLPLFIFFCGVACRGFNFAQELLCTTRVRQPKYLRRLPVTDKKCFPGHYSLVGSDGNYANASREKPV